MNADKCQFLTSNHKAGLSIKVGEEVIQSKRSAKLLGFTIDNKLRFNEHVSNICTKVSMKLHALAKVSHFMNTEKLRLIVKAFIESQFGSSPLMWMFHSRTLDNRINRLHERALRLVYKDPSLTTFKQLLQKDNSFTIHHRNLQKLRNYMALEIMKYIFHNGSH